MMLEMFCALCGQDYEAREVGGMTFLFCPDCPPDLIIALPRRREMAYLNIEQAVSIHCENIDARMKSCINRYLLADGEDSMNKDIEVKHDEDWDYVVLTHPLTNAEQRIYKDDASFEVNIASASVGRNFPLLHVRSEKKEWTPAKEPIAELRALMDSWRAKGLLGLVAAVETLHDDDNDDCDNDPCVCESKVYDNIGHFYDKADVFDVPVSECKFYKENCEDALTGLITTIDDTYSPVGRLYGFSKGRVIEPAITQPSEELMKRLEDDILFWGAMMMGKPYILDAAAAPLKMEWIDSIVERMQRTFLTFNEIKMRSSPTQQEAYVRSRDIFTFLDDGIGIKRIKNKQFDIYIPWECDVTLRPDEIHFECGAKRAIIQHLSIEGLPLPLNYDPKLIEKAALDGTPGDWSTAPKVRCDYNEETNEVTFTSIEDSLTATIGWVCPNDHYNPDREDGKFYNSPDSNICEICQRKR